MRYEPLTRRLESQRADEVRLTFGEIEEIVGRPLPGSARRHPAWWANTSSHSHADAWLRIGWKTRDLDLRGERITFRRQGGDARPVSGLSESPRPWTGGLVLARDVLSTAARRIVEAESARAGVSHGHAAAELLNRLAASEKRRVFERFPWEKKRSSVDSVDLIREDRDAR